MSATCMIQYQISASFGQGGIKYRQTGCLTSWARQDIWNELFLTGDRRISPPLSTIRPKENVKKSQSPHDLATELDQTFSSLQIKEEGVTRHWNVPTPTEGLLSTGTPFKKGVEFFVPTSPRDSTYATSIPGPHLPDPLQGMASSQTYSIPNESISQAAKGKGRYDPYVPPCGEARVQRTTLERVSEVDEESFHTAYARRDPPPHSDSKKDRNEKAGKDQREGRSDLPPSNPTRPSTGARDSGFPSSRREGVRGRRERDPIQLRSRAGGDGDPSDDSSGDEDPPERGRRGPRSPPPPRRQQTPDRLRRGRSHSPPGAPPSDPGGGSSSSSSSGPSDHRFLYIVPGAPYRTMVPTIEPKIKVELLPEWDRNHETAIDYFWEVSQVANLLGWLPRALGFWLPSRLKQGSQIQLWFATLPTSRQAQMRSHYLVYLQTIKDRYLGKRWQLRMNLKFEQQSFRQSGHEKESPQKFLSCRTQYVCLLANTDNGGPLEVFLIMRKAPIAWSTIIVLENIKSTEELYERVNEHEEELVEVVTRNPPDTLTLQNLPATLCRLGLYLAPWNCYH
ncbi:hypothetical protein B0H13DRAFT_1885354 [Mycena leptocephala]|nr:hypothetical protein B0H13DRAFT_1885354 [Mycena leptocephala]